MIELDGSRGEGGGAILRQALALSTYTGKPFHLDNIRAERPDPGMNMQHLTALNTAQRITNAKVEGNVSGSEEITFHPERLDGGSYQIDIETAGSITLLLQAFLLPCCFTLTKHKFTIKGGTDVKWSPPWDYFRNVFLPHVTQFATVDTSLERRGYYPKGDGEVSIIVDGGGEPDDEITLSDTGELFQIKGVSHASTDVEARNVAERQAKNAEIALGSYDCPVNVRREYANTASTGSGITLWSIHGDDEGVDMDNPVIIGASSLGEPQKNAADVAEEAADALRREHEQDAAVDKHLSDQLIPYLAVTGGTMSVTEVTGHTLSNIYVAKAFLPVSFTIEDAVITAE